jgi:energy-coupling factor transport system ATP-binding protein
LHVTGPAIRIENLHYTYPFGPPDGGRLQDSGTAPALCDISLGIQAGEFVALMGAVGAGKTTLCLALNGLVPQSSGGVFGGDVWIRNWNTKTHAVAELSTRVGCVFQEPESQLFNMTVEDEVAFGPENLGLAGAEIEARITWALDVVGLGALRLRSPAGLSGGQQQRLALAAVLAMRPEILVLDEPTAGLDPHGRRTVLDVVAGLRRQGATVVMATQDAEAAAALADRVIVLAGGHVALEGDPRHVFAQGERLRELGVNVPQPAELSLRLGVDLPWLTVEEAVAGISSLPHPSAPAAEVPHRLPPPLRFAERGMGGEVPIAVRFEDVHYHYNDGTPALNGVDLTLMAGEYVALIGANGSGKTTLARHINGLLQPQSGRVVVAGNDTRRTSAGALAHRVGYVFQNPDHQIFAPSVRAEIAFGPQNLGLAPAEVERRVADALEAFQLTALAETPPAALGYGLRRLVTLASVHAMRSHVLVLDEPTAGLDHHLAAQLLDWVMQRHATGATVVFITHDMRLAALAPRCIALADGRVALDAPTADAFARADLLAACDLDAPPVTQIARRLGLAGSPLTVDDFCRQLSPLKDGGRL